MYKLVKLQDTVRIPPQYFGEDLLKIIENTVQKAFEGTVRRDHGVIVVVDSVTPLGDGIVIHGDGGMYQKVEFQALTYMPVLQEVIDAVVCEIVEFGAFCHIGPLDALVHMSQLMNDYVEIDAENERIAGKENKRTLSVGDSIRARVVAVSLNELSARESKIGLTMRQASLGSHAWLEEDRKGDAAVEAPKDKKQQKKGKK